MVNGMSQSRYKKVKLILSIFTVTLALAIGLLLLYGGKTQKEDLIINPITKAINIFKDVRIEQKNHTVVRPTQIGEQFATLSIPSLNYNQPVYEGDTDEVLSIGIGHYEGSTVPGENGNVLLAGHRDMANEFTALQNIKEGDEVIMKMSYGDYYYKVSEIKIVDPDNTEVGAVSDHEKLTMYTCYPFDYIGHAPNRYVVICDFVKVK